MNGARWSQTAFTLLLAALATVVGAAAVCGRDANGLYDGDRRLVVPLASRVAHDVEAGIGTRAFRTGSARFDGEWAYGTYVMSVLGLSQVALAAAPSERHAYVPVLRTATTRLLNPELRAFGTTAWGTDGLERSAGHAYLGYAALAIGLARKVDPDLPVSRAHDALVDALAEKLDGSAHGVFETYPGETYPPDVAMVIGAVALHGELTGRPREALVKRAITRLVGRYVDPRSGLLVQSVSTSGDALDAPRASGTALAAYALAFADEEASRMLGAALARATTSVLGFGAVREYPEGTRGRGDIDSGPTLLGVSVSATGFSLASARLTGDRAWFTELHRTTHLFGVPIARTGSASYLTGGPLGNAILLAMTTAGPGSRVERRRER